MIRWKQLRTWQKGLFLFTSLIGSYLAIGYLLHLIIFPEQLPDTSTYFQSGDVFER